ncbi:unnamed protein product [Ectocarpus sp. 4 AP-2014]
MAWGTDEGQVVKDKMLNAVLEQDSFVAAFTGNSIAAGHDCLYEQSYPILLNATMGRLMAAAGVGYTAINVAMGNTRAAPYSYCVDAHAGLDADIVSWSFGMEIATLACEEAAAAVELFIRSSLVLPRRPAILVLDAQADQGAKGRLELLKHRNRRFLGYCGGPKRNLMEAYRDFGVHNIFASSLILEHAAGDERFAHEILYAAGKHYPRPMKWHPAPAGHELVADMLFMHYGKLFLEAIDLLEQASPGLTAAELREKHEQQGQQPQQERSREHDGGASSDHGTISMEALRKAVGLAGDNPNVFVRRPDDQARRGGGEGEESPIRPPPTECSYMGGGRGRGVLPPAEWCSGAHCQEAGNYRCANTYYPLDGNQGSRLLDMVVSDSDGEGEGEGAGENGDPGNPAGLFNRDAEKLRASPSEGRWAVTLNEVSRPAINYMRYGRAPEGYHKPIDVKWVLVGDAGSGPIEFEFFTGGVPLDEAMDRKVTARSAAAVVMATGVQGVEGAAMHGLEAAGEHPEAAAGATAVARAGGQAGVLPLGPVEAAAAAALAGTKGVDSRVVVCKPDFIERVDFADPGGVVFSIDGVETSVVPAEEDGLMTQSCSLLAAEVGPGRHRLEVAPLRRGEPFVAISHVIYPA